jgi:hypothetical protein
MTGLQLAAANPVRRNLRGRTKDVRERTQLSSLVKLLEFQRF